MRRHISKEVKEIAIDLWQKVMDDEEIDATLGIRPRTMRRLRKLYTETGQVVQVPVVAGRPRLLSAMDVGVRTLKRLSVL